MTAVLSRPEAGTLRVPVGYLGAPRVLRSIDTFDLAAHREAWGPQPAYTRSALLAMLDAVHLTGRGGAGFPLVAKIRSLRAGAEPIVVVNGAEGEPISAKDRVLLGRTPHLVLDGAQLVAAAIGARRILVAVTDPAVIEPLHHATAGRPGIEVHAVPARFVAGEARALISALNGGSDLPPGRRVLPTDRGVSGQPTLLSNAETFAQLAVLGRVGPAAFGSVGTPDEPGTTLLTVTGAVASPGVLEVPVGSTLGAVATAVGASATQAVVVGGYHGSWLAPAPDLVLSRAGLAAAGGTLGAGVLAFIGEQTCPLAELARVASWLAAESARQCGPCAFGLPALATDVRALVDGAPSLASAQRRAAQLPGRGACAHPDGAVRFVRSGLALLADEVARHRGYGGCRRADRGQLATTRVWS